MLFLGRLGELLGMTLWLWATAAAPPIAVDSGITATGLASLTLAVKSARCRELPPRAARPCGPADRHRLFAAKSVAGAAADALLPVHGL